MKKLPQRKSPRLQGYDYSQSGAYFVTICTHQRQHLFGEVVDAKMVLNAAGNMAYERWLDIPKHYPDIELDAFVVMPNHMHGIVCIIDNGSNFRTYLGRAINAYKGAVTARIRQFTASEMIVWQGRYHDRIIRNQRGYNYIRRYVDYNPAWWAKDKFYDEE